jgi:hypothetical protein
MSKTSLLCCLAGKDAFAKPAFVVLPDAPEFKKFGAWELVPDTLKEASLGLGSVVD